jgi:type IV secretion system protein VirB4
VRVPLVEPLHLHGYPRGPEDLDKFRKWRQKISGFFDQVFLYRSRDAVSMVADADAAIAEVNSGWLRRTATRVVIVDENRHRSKRLHASSRAVNALGFAARIEPSTRWTHIWAAARHGVENVRRPLINTMTWRICCRRARFDR